MADNVQISAGSGTSIATDDVGGVQFQRVKVVWGADGVANDTSAASPLPVTAASLPLPTGAATAAKQPALGTAGTPSTDVLTVQGAASMTPLKIDGSAATQPVSGTVTANAGTNLNTSALALESGGNLAGIVTRIGEVQASPTANTLLDRLKALLTGIVLSAGSAIIGKVGIDQTTPGVTNGVQLTGDLAAGEYETVAASQTDQALGATGGSGDYLAGVLIVPGTTAAGAVSIKDGAGSAISIFAGGGTTALTTLIPFFVPLGIRSTSGAWKITTGTNVTAIGVGNFT